MKRNFIVGCLLAISGLLGGLAYHHGKSSPAIAQEEPQVQQNPVGKRGMEYSIVVDAPLEKVWDFYIDPNNWPTWIDQLESCTFDGKLKAGSIVQAKTAGSNDSVPIMITDVKPYEECGIVIKAPFFTQRSTTTFEKVSPKKTRVTMQTSTKSLFSPFIKSKVNKKIESMLPKFSKAVKNAN